MTDKFAANEALVLPRQVNNLDPADFVGDLDVAYCRLRERLDRAVNCLLVSLSDGLSRLAGNKVLGAVEWIADDPPGVRATYHSHVGVWVETQTFPSYGVRDLMHRKVTHHVGLINARTITAQAASGLFGRRLPKRVKTLLKHCPSVLLPELQIIEGVRIRYQRIEVDTGVLKSEITPYVHRDPLLVWGNLVLVGWDCEEVAAERRLPRLSPYAIS
jgi:hypothetical protein